MAQGISADSCGLIFGVNRFISLILQSSLTFILTDENGLALDERPLFLVYGIYFLLVGGIFATACVLTWRRMRPRTSHQPNGDEGDLGIDSNSGWDENAAVTDKEIERVK